MSLPGTPFVPLSLLVVGELQEVSMSDAIHERVQAALDKVRPYLQGDGGDVELVEITADGVVRVRLTGACKGCPMSQQTLKGGVERMVLKEVAEVKRVEAV
jgi:Fe-S cluster biogenesis protein NfuA